MEFNNNKPIYRQIIDYCFGRILAGEWTADNRVPSVKELSVTLTVNNRTALKAYEEMEALGVIYQKRGLGFFVTPEAIERIRNDMREEFFRDTLPRLKREMSMMQISPEELIKHLRD